jgi:hypothetical protein
LVDVKKGREDGRVGALVVKFHKGRRDGAGAWWWCCCCVNGRKTLVSLKKKEEEKEGRNC